MENQTPQLEQGYTKIANKILEKLAMYRISGEEWLILLTILRKTYGYNKKEDFISISQFYEATGLAKPSICRAINKLLKKNVINKKAKGDMGLYSFNKLFATWKPFTKKLMINNTANTINKKANPHLLKSDIQKKKETITKETTYLVEKITLWAYKRARVSPSCSQDSFRRSVMSALDRVGEWQVNRLFEQEDNAIRFLKNIKTL
jgi:phage replication O-like protein O